jgi:hypothetical protein
VSQLTLAQGAPPSAAVPGKPGLRPEFADVDNTLKGNPQLRRMTQNTD